jgi:hypothetical protein
MGYSVDMRRMFLVVAVVGCTSTPPPACITVDTTCAPGYVPTFDNVYANTLQTSCGSTRSSCHSATGRAGNMSFGDEITAYSDLLAPSHLDPKRPRVVPGNAACSLMIVRTDSPGADYQMPVGDPLPAPERCALIQWVAAGAPGPGSGSGSAQ